MPIENQAMTLRIVLQSINENESGILNVPAYMMVPIFLDYKKPVRKTHPLPTEANTSNE